MALRGVAGKARLSHALAAAVFIAAFLAVGALAAAPALHTHLHSDAANPHHECAITVVQSGIECGDGPLRVAAPGARTLFCNVAVLPSVWVPALFLGACIFEHAPPALS